MPFHVLNIHKFLMNGIFSLLYSGILVQWQLSFAIYVLYLLNRRTLLITQITRLTISHTYNLVHIANQLNKVHWSYLVNWRYIIRSNKFECNGKFCQWHLKNVNWSACVLITICFYLNSYSNVVLLNEKMYQVFLATQKGRS